MTPADQTQRERLARIEAPEPAWEQYLEDIGMETSADESGTWSLTTGQFLLASIVVCMGAIAFVL